MKKRKNLEDKIFCMIGKLVTFIGIIGLWVYMFIYSIEHFIY